MSCVFQRLRLRIDGSWGMCPDVGVYCDPNDDDQQFRERPCLLVEVASPSTRRVDRTDKLTAYTGLPWLLAYLVVQPDIRPSRSSGALLVGIQ